MAEQEESNEIVFDVSEPISKPEPEQAKTETPPVAENAEEAEQSEPAEAETDKESDKKPEKVFTQAELDAIIQKRVNKLERKLTQQFAQPQQEVKPEVREDEPRIEDFTDYADYVKAAAKYEVRQELAAERKAQQESDNKRSYEAEESRKAKLAETLMDNGHEKYADFDDVAESTGDLLRSKNLKFSTAMMGALYETENSHDIVYHLGKNPEEAERIARLSPYAQAKEIGKLEDKLSAKKPVKPSSAPAPATPINSGKSASKSYEDMTTDEYIADARKRGAAWAR